MEPDTIATGEAPVTAHKRHRCTARRQRLPERAARTTVVVAIAWLLLHAPIATALPPIPSMACPIVAPDQAPRVDGLLDDAAWAKADVQTKFHRHFGGLDRPLAFHMVADSEWLYVATTASTPVIPDGKTEIVAVFIAPSKAWDHYMRFSVTMTADGIVDRRTDGLTVDPGDWQAAFRQHADRWVVEMAIPLAPVFGAEPITEGKAFDLNLSRTRIDQIGDDFDHYQQWSNTGASEGSRYRFGEVVFGALADRLRAIAAQLRHELAATQSAAAAISAASRRAYEAAADEAAGLIRAMAGQPEPSGAEVRAHDGRARALARRLRRALLVDRGVLVWSCDPMAVPEPADLPPADVADAEAIDLRVLGGEWESAALVVTNLTEQTFDGQVLLSDFVASDGVTKAGGWDVLQVRSAPQYQLRTGRKKRDPLPRLPEGDLFRVAPDQNELLWLTFRSRDLAPGRYTATLNVRSLDDRHTQDVRLTLRVLPLALGAEGRPHVHCWNSMLRGRDWAERAANCRDYYITCSNLWTWDELPRYTADADGTLLDDTLDFSAYDRHVDAYMQSQVHTYLPVLSSHKIYFWPMQRADGSTTFEFERWSPRFNALFHRWVRAYRDHLAAKGLPPERWAFYIMDEPFPGENRAEVAQLAREVRRADPRLRTYITFPVGRGTDAENLELSRHLTIAQFIGSAKPAVMKQIVANVQEFWRYHILLRGNSPFLGYRREACWHTLRDGAIGTGFWVWDSSSQNDFLWRDASGTIFPAIYNHHDGTIIPSLRAEAFREGIEDWKYVLMLDAALERARQHDVDAAVLDAAAAFRVRCLDDLDGIDSVAPFRRAAQNHLLALHVALGDIVQADVDGVLGE